MSQSTITVEGRRVYIQTRYGDPCVPILKRMGAHWEPQTKRWWLTAAKTAEVEAAVAKTAGQPDEADAERKVTVVGKARYKGRTYYVRWVGQCQSGAYKARLCSLDGKIDFWATAARPHEFHVTGDGDVAQVTNTYQEARSLDSIRRYIERVRREEKAGVVRGGKPDEECYWGGEDWLVQGCSACRAEGRMCRSCRHDIYDN